MNELAQAFEAACFSDSERKRLVEAGAKRAAEFAQERFAAGLLAAFEAVMAGPREGLWRA